MNSSLAKLELVDRDCVSGAGLRQAPLCAGERAWDGLQHQMNMARGRVCGIDRDAEKRSGKGALLEVTAFGHQRELLGLLGVEGHVDSFRSRRHPLNIHDLTRGVQTLRAYDPGMGAEKVRVDILLVERGHFESRAKASAAVLAGDVQLKTGGRRIDKPGQMLPADTELIVAAKNRYVSRGGIKLENSLAAFPEIDPAGRKALDAGASTGGFTDCLLQRGAEHVIAVDVAYGELHMSLRDDPRVTVIERKNVRELTPDDLEYAPDLIVADLSFIALEKVLPALRGVAAERFDFLALVKPQFEVGRERIGKGGVVREREDRVAAIEAAAQAAQAAGFSVQGACSSGLPGPAGNREAFLWLAESDRPGVADLRAAAEGVESQ